MYLGQDPAFAAEVEKLLGELQSVASSMALDRASRAVRAALRRQARVG